MVANEAQGGFGPIRGAAKRDIAILADFAGRIATFLVNGRASDDRDSVGWSLLWSDFAFG